MRRKRLSRFATRLKQESFYPLAKIFFIQNVNKINALRASGKLSKRAAETQLTANRKRFKQLTGVSAREVMGPPIYERHACVCDE